MNFSFTCSTLVYGRPQQGKSTLIKYLMSVLDFQHLYIVSKYQDTYANVIKDYSAQDKPIFKGYSDNYIPDEIDKFLMNDGIKIIVLDDILHFEFDNKKVKTSLRSLLSTTAHTNTYVLVGVQNMTSIGKSFRLCCENFITFQLDEDSLKMLNNITGQTKANIRKSITLGNHQFIATNSSGQIVKARIKLKNDEELPKYGCLQVYKSRVLS